MGWRTPVLQHGGHEGPTPALLPPKTAPPHNLTQGLSWVSSRKKQFYSRYINDFLSFGVGKEWGPENEYGLQRQADGMELIYARNTD